MDKCVICNRPLGEEEYQFQDTGEPVHVACRNGTFWEKGERVVPRFWGPGDPVGTVKDARVVYERVAVSDEVKGGPVEWVTVQYDDGEVREYAAWDLRKAPEQAI